MRRVIRVAWHWLTIAVLALAVPFAGYGAAGMIGGAIPANRGWRAPAQGVRIYVETNGVHTGLVLPVAAAGVDWRDLVRAEDIADPRYAGYRWLAFGWGDADFYLNTPTWADVDAGTVLRAAIGGRGTLMHVDHLGEPAGDRDARAIVLRPEEYRRLAAFVRASFRVDARAAHRHGYGGWDAFYAANGRYDALDTCNAWTGRGLRQAGVRVGAWTPFAVTVMGWFRE